MVRFRDIQYGKIVMFIILSSFREPLVGTVHYSAPKKYRQENIPPKLYPTC